MRVDIVADSYLEESIKMAERNKRGSSEKIIIQSGRSKIPCNFSKFWKNGENKRCLLLLMLSVLVENRTKVTEMLHCSEIFFSTKNNCVKLTASKMKEEELLSSNQEEGGH